MSVVDENIAPIKPIFPSVGELISCTHNGAQYKIVDVIGEGSFGRVFGAVDAWGNEVAIKVLKPRGTYEHVRSKCVDEMRKLTELRHPQITYIYDAFEYRNAFHIVTEKCVSSLDGLLKARNFDWHVWLMPIAHSVLQAVEYIHSRGYLHQDIHAGNVFSTYAKNEILPSDRTTIQFRVGDLGISRLVQEVTSESTMADWMRPPEVLQPDSFGELGRGIDIYHLGLLFLQIVLGGNIRFTNAEILNGKPSEIAKKLNIPIGSVIAKALSLKVADRQDSPIQMWKEFRIANGNRID